MEITHPDCCKEGKVTALGLQFTLEQTKMPDCLLENKTNINQDDQIADTDMLPNEDIQCESKLSSIQGTPEVLDEPGTFKVDRSQIAEVQLSDETVELQTLGLSVYDQDTLEQGILDQVDQALEELDRRKLEQQIKAVADDILICKQDLKKAQTLLKALEITGTSGQKQAVSVKKAVEVKSNQLKTLQVRAANLKLKYDGNVDDVEADLNGEVTISHAISGKRRQEESERDRKIRAGEMTPFGNALDYQVATTAGSYEGLTEFEKYLQSQAELQKKRKIIKNKKGKNRGNSSQEKEDHEYNDNLTLQQNKKSSPLKKRILLPKKRKKKEKIGTYSSDEWWDHKKRPGKLLSEETALEDSEGSEYLPSDSELEMEKEEKCVHVKMKQKKLTKSRCRKQHYQDSEEWGTDDSDWEYSDEETRAKRRKSTKKEIDDGNLEDYHERLKFWEEQKAKQPELEHSGCHEMEGGYKIPTTLWTKLYNYQKVGVQWLWELNQQRCGGILGDEMGLGKTVQIIAFLAGLNHSNLVSHHGRFRGLGPTLIVCPTTVMHQWVREFHIWWPQFRVAVLHGSGSFHGKRKSLIGQMNHVGCVLVTSYVGAVQHQETLISRNWHYVILDEGHKIRNPDAQVTLAVKQIKTPHRLILSGSPMQNNLKELWSLFDFVFPGKLGTLPVFLAQMAVPITQGGYSNASEVQVATAYRCAMVLRDTIAPYLLRRMKTDVKTHIRLPSKNEQVLFCRLTEEQRSLYKSYLNSGEVERILQGRFQVFMGLIALRKICNHPDLYSGGPELLRGENEEDLPEESRYGYWKRAGKMLVVESLLNIWYKQKHRVLLFTQSRQMLCILEAFIQKQGYKYMKLDGGTGIASRQPLINKFNEDASYFVFILTTRVGGLGVNLTGADRVVIYDPDWNPATDTQARERAWRIGQQNNVTVYRLVTAGTIEEKVYHRQIFKQFLCNKVLKDPRQRRFFKSNDLLELFTLAESERTTETAAIFAGTGSEVKLNHKRSKPQKDKISYKKNTDSKQSKNEIKVEETVKFSKSKLEHMKRLAKLLSKQVVTSAKATASESGGIEIEKSETTENCKSHIVSVSSSFLETSTNESIMETKLENCDSVEIIEESVQNSNLELKMLNGISELPENKSDVKHFVKSDCGSTHTSREHGKKHHRTKKHSHRKRKGVVFEGKRVPYLVGQSEAQMHQAEGEESAAQQDDYVLRKLFKKSGIQTAMRHDTIMEGGDADYALVEGEAKRVAKEAIKALKESRRQCWQADSGVPSWTGLSGAVRPANTSFLAKHRFGKKKPIQNTSTKPSRVKSTISEENSDLPMSSSELLSRMRSRNHLLEPLSDQSEPQERQDDAQEENQTPSSITSPSSSLVSIQEEHMELLTDIRNFIAFGASVDGRASTQEILLQFSNRLPSGSSPLFKFMLSEICEFHRMPSGEGVWKLRTEFRW